MSTIIALVATALAAMSLPARAASPFDPDTGFRIAHYRAAVPETVPGGTRIDRDRLDALIRDGVVLLDVMAATGAGPHPQTGAWQLAHEHRSIPGAVWLPDVGRGKLDAAMQSYLADNLAQLTAGDRATAIVIFCQADCWMGWNAVQRIARLGYTRLYWFPEGTDGWMEWGDRELHVVTPVAVAPQSKPSR